MNVRSVDPPLVLANNPTLDAEFAFAHTLNAY